MWQTVTRERLYQQVWSVPIWTLCQQYGLSDNGLREICKRDARGFRVSLEGIEPNSPKHHD